CKSEAAIHLPGPAVVFQTDAVIEDLLGLDGGVSDARANVTAGRAGGERRCERAAGHDVSKTLVHDLSPVVVLEEMARRAGPLFRGGAVIVARPSHPIVPALTPVARIGAGVFRALGLRARLLVVLRGRGRVIGDRLIVVFGGHRAVLAGLLPVFAGRRGVLAGLLVVLAHGGAVLLGSLLVLLALRAFSLVAAEIAVTVRIHAAEIGRQRAVLRHFSAAQLAVTVLVQFVKVDVLGICRAGREHAGQNHHGKLLHDQPPAKGRSL